MIKNKRLKTTANPLIPGRTYFNPVEVKKITEGHTANRQQSLNANLGPPHPSSIATCNCRKALLNTTKMSVCMCIYALYANEYAHLTHAFFTCIKTSTALFYMSLSKYLIGMSLSIADWPGTELKPWRLTQSRKQRLLIDATSQPSVLCSG